MNPVHIRRPEPEETPLSPSERLVAIREGFHPYEIERWHPQIARNWSLLSARTHRAQAIAALPAHLAPARAFAEAA
ncbi:hypothetical protein [Variovorax sp. 160MFSha2.1]|uniref:hypothetical protein n=1 Tax=Variovorax sp. 160MFSha2.1 TaxID=3158367 RepID=UPI003AAE64FF